MPRSRGAHWNRAGRRSGGDKPSLIYAEPQLSPEAEERLAREALLRRIRERSPIDLIVAWILRDDPEIKAALKHAGVNYDA